MFGTITLIVCVVWLKTIAVNNSMIFSVIDVLLMIINFWTKVSVMPYELKKSGGDLGANPWGDF